MKRVERNKRLKNVALKILIVYNNYNKLDITSTTTTKQILQQQQPSKYYNNNNPVNITASNNAANITVNKVSKATNQILQQQQPSKYYSEQQARYYIKIPSSIWISSSFLSNLPISTNG
jgi:hypothetical protein